MISRRILLAIGLLLSLLLTGTPVPAHEIRPAIATVSFDGKDHYTFDITLNLEALLAGVSPKHADTDESPNAQSYNRLRAMNPEALRTRFRAQQTEYLDGVIIEFDDRRQHPVIASVDIPAAGNTGVARISRLRLTGRLPPEARVLRVAYAAPFGNCILRLPGVRTGEITAVWLVDGRKSEPYVLGVGLESPSRGAVIGQYVGIGFTHILPKGLDHILFVLGLFLLAARLRPLLWQVTAFTLAHTLTLGLSMYGVVQLPATVVEPLIALSIVVVAVENLLTSRLHAWRVAIVFGFGLLHGLGFAGVLRDIGLPRGDFVTGLISFNVGVELGQLAVIGMATLAVGVWFRNRPWYRSRIVLPASALIALTGFYWTVERILF